MKGLDDFFQAVTVFAFGGLVFAYFRLDHLRNIYNQKIRSLNSRLDEGEEIKEVGKFRLNMKGTRKPIIEDKYLSNWFYNHVVNDFRKQEQSLRRFGIYCLLISVVSTLFYFIFK